MTVNKFIPWYQINSLYEVRSHCTCVCVIQVAAANREVEATNAKRAQESERSLQALRQKAADDYTKQVKLTSLSFALGRPCTSHPAQLCNSLFCIHCCHWSVACMLVLCYAASTAMELISSKSLCLTSALYLTVIQDWASLQEGVIHSV